MEPFKNIDIKKEITMMGKFTIAIVIGFVGILGWLDARFILAAHADDFVKKDKIISIERIIQFQEFNYVSDRIEEEESKEIAKQNRSRLDSYYKQKVELKKTLGL